MNKQRWKRYVISNLLGLLVIVVPGWAAAQALPVVHIDIDFDSYSPGALQTTPNTPFSGYNPVTATVVQGEGSNRFLHVNRDGGGGLTTSTANALNTKLALNAGQQYEWSFSFFVPENSASQTLAIRLDDGSPAAGRFVSGLLLSNGKLHYLSNPNVLPYATGFTTIKDTNGLDVTVTEEVWYEATFVLSTVEQAGNLSIVSNLVLQQGENVYTVSTNYLPANLVEDSAVRMIISTGTQSNIYLDNFKLQTIPEPQASVAILILGVVGLACVRNTRKSRK